MNRWLRRGLWAAATMSALVAAAFGAGLALAHQKLNRHVAVPALTLALGVEGDDAGARERGRYLFVSRGCADCHGTDGAGRRFIDSSAVKASAPNISPGSGSVVAGYTQTDWVRTLRHGVKPDGRPLMIMPSEDYNRFTDADVAALVAYVRALPPVAGSAANIDLAAPVRVMYGFGVVRDAAEKIDHGAPPSTPVAEAVSAEHGRYVANMCIGCHGERLLGGKIPGGPPDWPAAARLAPGAGSAMDRYTDAASLRAMFSSGRRPDGVALKVMPFGSLRELSELDVQALYLYLKSLPAGGA